MTFPFFTFEFNSLLFASWVAFSLFAFAFSFDFVVSNFLLIDSAFPDFSFWAFAKDDFSFVFEAIDSFSVKPDFIFFAFEEVSGFLFAFWANASFFLLSFWFAISSLFLFCSLAIPLFFWFSPETTFLLISDFFLSAIPLLFFWALSSFAFSSLIISIYLIFLSFFESPFFLVKVSFSFSFCPCNSLLSPFSPIFSSFCSFSVIFFSIFSPLFSSFSLFNSLFSSLFSPLFSSSFPSLFPSLFRSSLVALKVLYSWVIICLTNCKSSLFLIPLWIGIFSIAVIIFFCLITDWEVPSSFWIISIVGFSKVSIKDFGSIFCPGIIAIVFSSFIWMISPFSSLTISSALNGDFNFCNSCCKSNAVKSLISFSKW